MRKRLLNLCLTALMSVVSTAAWALSDVNGVYQISSAEDWNEFAALVNDGAVTANAALTADIDLGMNVTMVGINDNNGAYHGTFDGQGHTIKINMYQRRTMQPSSAMSVGVLSLRTSRLRVLLPPAASLLQVSLVATEVPSATAGPPLPSTAV